MLRWLGCSGLMCCGFMIWFWRFSNCLCVSRVGDVFCRFFLVHLVVANEVSSDIIVHKSGISVLHVKCSV